MHVIILAAGQSKRFQEEGYNTPKPFLNIEWRGTTLSMIEHVMNTIPIEFTNVIGAVPPKYSTSKGYFAIEHTRGPAHTALEMLDLIEPRSCLFMDSDILNFTNDLYRLTRLEECGVLVSKNANPSFSYVSKLGIFNHIAEKKRISEYAVRGAYYISERNMIDFILALKAVVETQKEPYLSQVFDTMACTMKAIETSYTPVDWGTPRDVRISGAHIVSKKG